MRIVVTGAGGGVGRHVVADLLAHGHVVHGLDRLPPPAQLAGLGAIWTQAEVRDLGTMVKLLATAGAEALIHLAAFPNPLHAGPLEVFGNNTEATFVALEAAGTAGVKRVALASSISLLGLPFASRPISPLYAPVDESHPNIGDDPYALSKEVDEAIAATMHRRHGYQVAALRIANSFAREAQLARASEEARDPGHFSSELWAYVDARDAARAFALAVELDIPGCHVINVGAPDTCSAEATADLMARYHPTTRLRRPLVGRETPFDITRCRELLGFTPKYLLLAANVAAPGDAP